MSIVDKELELAALWTDDCQGKKDYDGEICCISSRYWPRGGGFSVFDGKTFSTNGDQNIKPSAVSHIGIRLPDTDIFDLARKTFEGESFDEIKIQVEAWAKEQYERAVKALLHEFKQERTR